MFNGLKARYSGSLLAANDCLFFSDEKTANVRILNLDVKKQSYQ